MAKAQLLVATESFAVETGRREDDTPIMVIVRADATKLPADHKLVQGREHLFTPVTSAGRED
jgi:hypothetical protein